MFRNRIYYQVKPFIPRRVRLAMRRSRARSIQRSASAYWPIYEAAGNAPVSWPGWPEGKPFAFVLSHDVEGIKGVNRCRELAEIEMEYGFRSSFNFIPQGKYESPTELLAWLRKNGFEVGVHDLFHDGKLFRSASEFATHSTAINRYIKDWGAQGFRAGFMLHKLDWLHQLNIEYDSSTFDVDPFEPQCDGVQTIFPFWIQKPDPNADAIQKNGTASAASATQAHSSTDGANQNGYVELPCTIVQDYNLFVVLQERSDRVWREKLRWIADKGGMALLNTHPDYMALSGHPIGTHEFPIQYYRDFLAHVRAAYAGRYWHALPREVASYTRPLRPPQARPPRQVVMLTHSYYWSDNRVRRYAETLAKRGDKVRVFCLGVPDQVQSKKWNTLRGVEFLCLLSRTNQDAGKWSQARQLAQFFWRAYRAMNKVNLPHGCDLIHVHNIPDFLVFAGAQLKHRGAKVILDIHDIVPELFESKYGGGGKSILLRLLKKIELCSCRFADHVIVANHIWKETLLKRSLTEGKVTAMVNNVDLELFVSREHTGNGKGPVLIYPGTLNYHQGLDLAVKAVAEVAPNLPNIQLRIHGKGQSLPGLKDLATQLRVNDRVHFLPGVPLDKVADLMAGADIGIVPKRAEGFGNQAYSTKIMELMSQKLPVIVSRTKIDSLYFDDSVVAFFESGNHKDLASKILRIASDAEYRQTLARSGYEYAKKNSWESVKSIYVNLVDRLTATSERYPFCRD